MCRRRFPASKPRSKPWTVWPATRGRHPWPVSEQIRPLQGKLGPKLNEEKPAEYWYDKAEKDGNLAPQRKLANEKPPGITVDYDELIKSWKAEKPKG